jgi:hypothetical protein
MKNLLKPEQQREAQRLNDAAVRAWGADHKIGTQPGTYPEVSKAPIKSTKKIKR